MIIDWLLLQEQAGKRWEFSTSFVSMESSLWSRALPLG
jgi:hypothetical protein